MYLEIILLLLHFTPTVIIANLKIRKRPILKKLLPLPAPFQRFRFRVHFRFQPLSSKCFRFHKKLTASASTSLVTIDKFFTFYSSLYFTEYSTRAKNTNAFYLLESYTDNHGSTDFNTRIDGHQNLFGRSIWWRHRSDVTANFAKTDFLKHNIISNSGHEYALFFFNLYYKIP